MGILITIAALAIICLLAYAWFCISTRLDAAKTARLMCRAQSTPEDVELVRLVEGTEAIYVGLQFRGEVFEHIPGVQGVAAVRLFDELCEAHPNARHDGIKARPRKPSDTLHTV